MLVCAGFHLTTGSATLVTPPTNGYWEIRHIHITNVTGVAHTVTLLHGNSGTYLLKAAQVPANGYIDLYGFWTIDSNGSGAEISGLADANSAIDVQIMGYKKLHG